MRLTFLPLQTLLVALVAVPVDAQTYGSDDQAIAFFDTMCCQAGDTPIDQHTPEVGATWTVDGTTNDGLKPKITTSRVNFEPGSNAVAVGEGPTGERTTRAIVWEPDGHTADVTVYLMERYKDIQNYAALRLRWTPSSTTLAVDAIVVSGGATTTALSLGTLPVAGAQRHVPVEIGSVPSAGGHDWTVHVDGVLLPVAAMPGHVGEGAFALAAEAPAHPNPDGYFARVEDLVLLVPSTPIAVTCDGLRGWNAESCIRDEFAATRTYGYDEARDHLFETVWVEDVTTNNGGTWHALSGVYGGLVRSWRRESPLSAREQMQDQDFNTEHVWPRSRGAQPGPSTDAASHNDLHHLAPALGTFNSARSNRAFGDDFDQPNDTQKWLRNTTTRYSSSGPPSDPATWSRVELDFLRQPDDGNGYKDLSEQGRFDVRHALRGDVARMAAYFLVTYRIEAEDGNEGRAFIDATLDVLLDWHEQDPVDAFERERDERIYRIQGNRNPFVLDATLMARTFYQGPNQPRPRDLWINEIHHSNDGEDTHEGIEIAGRAGTDLYGYRVWTYSGYGFMYQVDGNGTDGTPAIAFRGNIDDEGGGMGAVWQGAERLRGGCQGLALTDPDGVILQFLSYGGCKFNATSGPVFDAAEETQPGAGAPSHPDSLAWSTVIRGAAPAERRAPPRAAVEPAPHRPHPSTLRRRKRLPRLRVGRAAPRVARPSQRLAGADSGSQPHERLGLWRRRTSRLPRAHPGHRPRRGPRRSRVPPTRYRGGGTRRAGGVASRTQPRPHHHPFACGRACRRSRDGRRLRHHRSHRSDDGDRQRDDRARPRRVGACLWRLRRPRHGGRRHRSRCPGRDSPPQRRPLRLLPPIALSAPTPSTIAMRVPLPLRALALLLAPLLAGCDAATGDTTTSTFSAAERAALMQYIPEAGVQITAEPATALSAEATLRREREEPCEDCLPTRRDYALRFGPGATRFASTFLVIQDQTFRIALDVRPDGTGATQTLLSSTGGLRFQVTPGGGIYFQVPGYMQDGIGIWTLDAPTGSIRAARWQRVEVSYNELLLRIAVDGVVIAQTGDYMESSAAVVGPVTFAPQFTGAIDRPRFSTYEGTEVYEAATFNEGRGRFARFTGLSSGSRRLYSPRWIARSQIAHSSLASGATL